MQMSETRLDPISISQESINEILRDENKKQIVYKIFLLKTLLCDSRFKYYLWHFVKDDLIWLDENNISSYIEILVSNIIEWSFNFKLSDLNPENVGKILKFAYTNEQLWQNLSDFMISTQHWKMVHLLERFNGVDIDKMNSEIKSWIILLIAKFYKQLNTWISSTDLSRLIKSLELQLAIS